MSDLETKLRLIFSAIKNISANILVFPEYSIPPELLRVVRTGLEGSLEAIVAGSHSIRIAKDVLLAYQHCGLKHLAERPSRNTRKAISPILTRIGYGYSIFKQTPSRWEPDLVLHSGEQELITIDVNGKDINIDIRICIDAISHETKREGSQLLIVPSWSPENEPFENLFSNSILKEIPGVLCNSAHFGGSIVVAANPDTHGAFDELAKMTPQEEGILIVDLDLESQYKKRGSAITTFPYKVVGRMPFLYSAVLSHSQASTLLMEYIKDNDTNKLKSAIELPNIPELLKEQLELLVEGTNNDTATQHDIRLLCGHLLLPSSVPPFFTRVYQALEESNRAVAKILSENPSDTKSLGSIELLSNALASVKKKALPCEKRLTPITEEYSGLPQQFMDRSREMRRLYELLEKYNIVILQGLPGIGRKSLLREVLKEHYFRHRVFEIHCVHEMDSRSLVTEIEESIGQDAQIIRKDKYGTARNLSILLIIHEFQNIKLLAEHDPLIEFMHRMAKVGVKAVLISSRKASLPGISSMALHGLSTENSYRVFKYWCDYFGAEVDEEIVARLYGYPFAAKLCARLLLDRGKISIDKIKFIKHLRKELIAVLLGDVKIDSRERKTIEVLSVFRRPVPEFVLDKSKTTGILQGMLQLEQKLLLERSGGYLTLNPIVKDYAVDEWLDTKASVYHHNLAADYYTDVIRERETAERFKYTTEAIYHLISSRRFNEASALGRDWFSEAKAAVRELWRNRAYRQCLDVCEQVINTKGHLIEFESRRVLCYARLRKWRKASVIWEKILKGKDKIPPWTYAGYGEILVMKGAATEGISVLQAGIETYPRNAYLHAALAESWLHEGDFETAESLSEDALELDQNNGRALDVASRVQRKKRNLKKAYELAKAAMGVDPRHAEKNFRKVISALKKQYNGQLPPFVDDKNKYDKKDK